MQRKLKIVYMGTPDFAVFPLKSILDAGLEVVGVVTNPDKPAGRGQKLQESPVKKFALQRGIPVLQPERFRDESFLEALAAWGADLQVVVAFKMLPEVVWNMPPYGTVNLHASLLPDYRGAAPINRVIMNGEKYSGVSTFLLKHEIDSGNVIFQKKVAIPDDMTAGELHDCLMEVGASLLVKTIKAIQWEDYPCIEQNTLLRGRAPLSAPKIFKEDMKIDWFQDITVIYNHIRGLSPFPTAWTELKNKETEEISSLKIYKAEKVITTHFEEIGKMDSDGKKRWDIYVKGGIIRLQEIQLSGKKKMSVSDFLCGFKPEVWQILE